MNKVWILVMPTPGRGKFEPRLLLSLFDHHAPDHVWMAWHGMRGFAMKGEDYERWANNWAPIELISPSHVRIYRLECMAEADTLIQKLQREFDNIVEEWLRAKTS